MQPSPNTTLPLITASWQKTLLPPPARDDMLPLADFIRPVPSRAEVLPEVSAAPRADVRPEVEAAGAVVVAVSLGCVAFFSSSPSSGNEIERPLGLAGYGDSEPSVIYIFVFIK